MICVFSSGVRSKHVDTEISIMRKLVHHKNILQLLDWNTTEGERSLCTNGFPSGRHPLCRDHCPVLHCSWFKDEGTLDTSDSLSAPSSLHVLICAEPYILIMEYVSYGTLRTFLQTNRVHLSADPELQSLLTIASYHIALALQHLRSKMVKTLQVIMIHTHTHTHTHTK